MKVQQSIRLATEGWLQRTVRPQKKLKHVRSLPMLIGRLQELMDCLISIPCFRESKRLPLFLDALCKELSCAPFSASVVIVDDGSGGPEESLTHSIVNEFRSKYPGIVAEPVFLKRNVGKGGAVYAGWKTFRNNSVPTLLCFADADGAVPATEVGRVIEELLADHRHRWDALFGSRVKMLGANVERRVVRHYIGRVFATLVAVLTGIAIYDSQCGLKVIRTSAFAAIQSQLKETRFVFDVELTLMLLQRGFRIREVPVNWKEIPGSKVSLLKDTIRMFFGILRIRRRCRTATNRHGVVDDLASGEHLHGVSRRELGSEADA
jgi:dolichyl-phosphate beta-glucosyltransferase